MLSIGQYRQWTYAPRQVLRSRSRNTQSPKALVPRKVQIFHERQTLWLVHKTNDFFSPTIGAGIVYCASCALGVRKENVWGVMPLVNQGQVFAEGKTSRQPSRAVMQRNAIAIVF
jgi:hypothetical protein